MFRIRGTNFRVMSLLYACSSILFILVVIIALVTNNRMANIEDTKSSMLDMYEYEKSIVVSDLYSYLSTNSTNYLDNKSKSHMIDSLRDDLYLHDYSSDKFLGADKILIKDSKYCLYDTKDKYSKEGMHAYYISTLSYVGELEYDIEFLVYTKDGLLVDIYSF